MNNTPRPELRMLLYCARTCLETQGAKQIKSLVRKDIEWTYLVEIARTHAVMPLLYRTLNSTCSDAVPKETLEELREHFYANAGRNLFLAKELLKLLHLFEAHEIPAIPYKGPDFGRLRLRQPCASRVRRLGHISARARLRGERSNYSSPKDIG